MRVPKYRAWHKVHRRMYEVTMLQWSAANPNELSKMELLSLDELHEVRTVSGADTIQNNYELLEYTGVKDANGKEIYEGDIIKPLDRHRFHPFKDARVVVDLEDGLIYGCDPFVEFAGAGWQGERSEDIEVIGNIYEHPELLQEEGKL